MVSTEFFTCSTGLSFRCWVLLVGAVGEKSLEIVTLAAIARPLRDL